MAGTLRVEPIHQIMLFFILAQLLSLAVGKIMIDRQNEPVFQALSVVPEEPGSPGNIVYLMTAILFTAVLLIGVLLLSFSGIILRLIEFLTSTVSMSIVFFVILFSIGVQNADILALLLSLALYAARVAYVPFRNIIAVVASAGVGALIGFSIDPFPIIIFVILMAIYDIIAVWGTKHMVQFAKHFVTMQTSFTIGAEGVKEVISKKAGKFVSRFEPIRLELGTGDLAIPAALAVSAYKLGSIVFPVTAIIGAVGGLYFILQRAQAEKRIYPAMPPIAVGSIIALLLAFLLYSM
jgi:presenilin-like A22 family membrane protease